MRSEVTLFCMTSGFATGCVDKS